MCTYFIMYVNAVNGQLSSTSKWENEFMVSCSKSMTLSDVMEWVNELMSEEA
jgi:hypothetical protein